MNTKDGMKENNFEVIRPGVNTTYQDFGRKIRKLNQKQIKQL